jgi:hypothetical protein
MTGAGFIAADFSSTGWAWRRAGGVLPVRGGIVASWTACSAYGARPGGGLALLEHNLPHTTKRQFHEHTT